MKKKKGRFLIRSGLLLIAAAVLLSAYNLYDGFRAGVASQEAVNFLEEQIIPLKQPLAQLMPLEPDASLEPLAPQPVAVDDAHIAPPQPEMPYAQDPIVFDTRKEIEIPDYVLNPDMEMPVSRYNGQDYIGILEIPAIDLKISVISEWTYPRLRLAPCRYSGSAYTNDLVISAHNYASHFGRLKELYEGAAVIFTDVDGNVFNYRVGLQETLKPRDVEYMKESDWDLTLFTCTPGGSYRATLRCELVNPYTGI